MHRAVSLAVMLSLAVLLAAGISAGAPGGDVLITDRAYVRHDGGTDLAITSCGSDTNSTTAGGNRQANEPAVAINPRQPKVIVAGANDYCTVPTFGDAWLGFYVSRDGGKSWVDTLLPGYPVDDSSEGKESPIFGRARAAGDPIMDWDNENRLFYGGISFDRSTTNVNDLVILKTNGDVIVSTWKMDPMTLELEYVRTVIVGKGTPSAQFFGRFNDKPSLKVDDWGPMRLTEGNVYVSWTLFPGAGVDQVLFSRSTDHGATFSKPIKVSSDVANAQGSDIAVDLNGTVYVFWRQFAHPASGVINAIMYVKSTDGGKTFSRPRTVAAIEGYDRGDRYDNGSFARDCGDGPFHCLSDYVFHRTDSLPQATVDTSGRVYVTWEQLNPVADDRKAYEPDGQGQVVFTFSTSTDGGEEWQPVVAVDAQSTGHQWWPNIEYDQSTGTLALIYYDSRDDRFYSPNRPPGNRLTRNGQAISSCGVSAPKNCNVLNTFMATSTTGGTSWLIRKVSTMGHQPEYEMFGTRNVPFHGDYLGVDAAGGAIFGVWTDNRDVVPGSDLRETIQDGFDVKQCRTVDPTTGSVGPDLCPNAGGLNQNIYGAGP